MDCDDVDLYGDLGTFEKETNQQDYQAENELLKTKCEELKKQLSETETRLKKLEEAHVVLSTNLSSLLKTARLEVSRKDRMISELRQTIDNAAFRRPNYKIPKRNEQTHDTNSRTTSSFHRNNDRDDKFTSKHANDSTRHNDSKKDNNKYENIPEVVDHQIKHESDYIDEEIKIEPENRDFKYEKYEEDIDEEEIYQPDKVCTTVFGERLQKKLQQQMLDEAAADKARKEKEIDIKPEIENKKNSLTTDLKVNNKENYYRLIPLDLKYEDKTRPDELLDKIKSYDVKSQNNNKRNRENSPNEYDKRRKINDADYNQRETVDRRRSRDGSSSSYDDRRTIKDETEYFCPAKSNDIDLRPRKSARNEREQRHQTNENSTSSSRGSRKNTRSNDRFDRNSSQTRSRKHLKEPICSKRIDQRSRSRSVNRKQNTINSKNNWRRNIKNSPRRNKRFEKTNDRYRDKNYERENPRSRSRDDRKFNERERDDGKFNERERDEKKKNYDNEKYNERENIKSCDKEKEKFDEKKKQQSPILDTNKSTDLRDLLKKRNQSNTNDNIPTSPSSPVLKNNPQIEKEKTPEKIVKEIKDSRVIETSMKTINEKIKNTNNNSKEKDNKKINNIKDILNTLEEGEIIESPLSSPVKKQTNNNDADNGSLNDSLKEEKIENIEKFILNSMSVDRKLMDISPIKNNNEKNQDKNSINDVLSDDNKSTEKTCVTSVKKSDDKLTKSSDNVEKLIDKTDQDDNNAVKLKDSTIKLISKTPLTSKDENDLSAENEKLLNLLDDAPDQVIIKPSTTNDSSNNIVDEAQLIDKAKTSDNVKETSNLDKEKITEENLKQDENNKNTSNSDVSEELLVISPISSSPEKPIDQECHEKINPIVSEKIVIINKIEKITTTSIESKIEIKPIDNNKKNIAKPPIKNSTETTQKKDLKENDKDKKKVITVLRRRRGPVKLSDSSKCMTLVRSDPKKI
ncbi:hypothetical protein HCN44_006185 [Aphidius gifuensis]|uniref:Uncharacterized protein n=1 Tax=Aphidius gifuensis TaxID=684658 RepID=A0A834Y5J7_APHGI|nr:uncharacterized protein PF11_0213-like [Aphidius gifuensis]KAF7997614.1 hypothetical protein HCN44_006185 [Aphidius gifuensis]